MQEQLTMPNVYADVARPLFGRALSGLDAEPTSPSQGSFDRTWWCWKFTDFSAPRFQEGAYILSWLATSAHSPVPRERRERLISSAAAAVRFWSRLQHANGSFDEAYPFERSLAATAFTGFYLGGAVERLGDELDAETRAIAHRAIERGAGWLAANGEYHGILSNHLAATASALQLAGDVLGTDRFVAARDRYLGIIYKHQHNTEGWMREYGGADPGYQSHGMFYLAEIERRTRDRELFERLTRATDFIAWFAHPDGTLGGEYASRGTKFAYPAAFEMLAARVPSAASMAVHLRERLSAGRGVSAREMDVWNQFPMLNNLLFAADAMAPITDAPPLPWQAIGAKKVFADAGLAVARAGDMVVAVGGRMGGAVKAWALDGTLLYEDCGYVINEGGKARVSQGDCNCTIAEDPNGRLTIVSDAAFHGIPAIRFNPWRFGAFRFFTITVGRAPAVARWLKDVLVWVLIRRKSVHPGKLTRTVSIDAEAGVVLDDAISGVKGVPQPLARHVPFHMGSSRYADLEDWLGALDVPAELVAGPANDFVRKKEIRPPA